MKEAIDLKFNFLVLTITIVGIFCGVQSFAFPAKGISKNFEEKDNKEKLPILYAYAKEQRFINLRDYEKYSKSYLNLARKVDAPEHIFNGHCLLAQVYFEKHDMALSQKHADTAFDMSITKDKDPWYAKSLYLQAMFSVYKFKLEDAIIQLDAVEKIFKNSRNGEYLAKVYLLRAQIAEYQNNIDESRNHYKFALREAEKVYDSIRLIPFKKYNADFHLRRGNFVKALTAYNALSNLEKRNKLDYALSSTLVGIATVYLGLDECEKAQELLNQAFILSMSSGNKLAKANASKYLGNCKTKKGQLQEAIENYRKALAIYEETGHMLGQGRVNNNLGVVAVQKENYKLAKSYFDKAMKIYAELPFLYSKSKTLRNLGKLCLETNQSGKGLEYLKQSNKLATEGAYTEVLQMNYLTLSNYYDSQGDFEKALRYQQKVNSLRDNSVKRFYHKLIEIQESYDRVLTKLDYQTKNQEFKHRKTLENKNRLIKLLVLLSILFFVIFSVATIFFYRCFRRKKKMLDQQIKGQQQNFEQKEKDIRIAQYTFNNLGDGIMWVRRDKSILYLNQTAREYSEKDQVQNLNDILLDFDDERWAELWKELEFNHPFIIKEFNIQVEKKQIPIEASFNMFSFEGTSFVAIMLKDISYRKRTEKSLREAKERAEESDRLKTRFIANISHEIRTPLNAIDGFTSELLETKDQEERAHYIDMINKSSKRLITLIDDIIDISKIEARNMSVNIELVELNPLLNELSNVFKQEIKASGKNIQLIEELPENGENIKVYADKNRYYQVLGELLNNALKFTKSGEIRLGYHILDQDLVEVYVKDTGIGISKGDQNRIFNVFSQADTSDTRPFQGSGLGLSIGQRLMDLMHGSLSFSSEKEKGSTFTTRLKYKKTTDKGKETGSERDISGLKVFILTDSSTSSSFLSAILKKEKVRVESFNSIKKLLLATSEKIPDVLLIGQSTVQFSEKQLFKLIKQNNYKTKLILISEGGFSTNVEYDGIIEPHYTKNEIYSAIASALEG